MVDTTVTRTPTDVAVIETAGDRDGSYVDWPAIIAGILLASAISVLFLNFGAAVGLSFVGFEAREGAPGWLVAVAAASWLLWTQISSLMAGGYLAGRLRRRAFDATEEESDMRDGAHGLLVWAGAAVIGAMLALAGVGAVTGTAGAAVGTITQAAGNAAEGSLDPNAYFVDTLFRAEQPADAATARAEAGRIFAQAALGDGTLPDADRTYLASLVSANTGLAPEEAAARVDEVVGSVQAARERAVEAARIARNTAVVGAFIVAAALLVSAIGAYWAAQKGGDHRDKAMYFADVFRRF
ncbi:hypothetical protein [Devosia geojensis]|uniref:hypothetical protein n=1 Tax=Devosia geojensis TaxID=443610 RepID=UPI000697E1B1|nr:hypothetical protein [Devosia geojensis]